MNSNSVTSRTHLKSHHSATPTKARIHRASTLLAKKIFDASFIRAPLTLLERSIAIKDLKMPNSIRSQSRKKHTIDTKEHLIMENLTNIINLPKMPFGKHTSYNEENDFVKKHILLSDKLPTEDQVVDMRKVSKMMRLNKKSQNKNIISMINRNIKPSIKSFESDWSRGLLENVKQKVDGFGWLKRNTPEMLFGGCKSGICSPKLIDEDGWKLKGLISPKSPLGCCKENLRNTSFSISRNRRIS